MELRNVTADRFSALGASYVGYEMADQADVVMNGNTLIAEGVTASDYAQFVAARSFFTDGDEEVYGQNILMQGNRLEMTDATLSGGSSVMSVSATDAGEARALNNTLEVSGLTARNDQGTAVTNVVAAHLDATQAVAENNATVVEDSSFTGTTRLWGVRLVAENQGIASGNHVALSGTKFSGTSNVAAVSLGATQAETENNVIIVEGIHGLNPQLTRLLPPETLFKIFVSALTSIAIDNHNLINPTDNRLIRRMVRDYKYRNYSALDTLKRWESVLLGEQKHIVPYQEEADAIFNSALIYELGALKTQAEPLLREVTQQHPEHSKALRLLKFFSYIRAVPTREIPPTSIIREFLGGSSFKY